MKKFGIVTIGRNEGERLQVCLTSVINSGAYVIYVDSGSTDGSIELARSMGAEVVILDMSVHFTAARARNAGLARLLELSPDLTYVQFVDGDCEVVADWLDKALAFLDQHDCVAVVCGRRRERHPEHSIYNLLCDIEWDTPVGNTKACGGDAMIRIAPLVAVGGYRDNLIAGEEPELCVRLRADGWQVWRLAEEMTLHDAAMIRFGQWWKRTQRSGFAFAEGAFLHGSKPEQHWVKESRSAWFWSGIIPMMAVIVSIFNGLAGTVILLCYPLQIGRLALRDKNPPQVNWLRAFYMVLGKFPELTGQLQFLLNRLMGSKSRLIEYK